MIALLLALAAPVVTTANCKPPSVIENGQCFDYLPAWDKAAEYWQPPKIEERSRFTMRPQMHVEYGPIPSGVPTYYNGHLICLGSEACDTPPDEAHCIWRADGMVEAKNATCKDREGTRP